MVLNMHKEDYEGLDFDAEWSASFHPDFLMAYSYRVAGPPVDWSWQCQQVLEDFGILIDNNYVTNVSDKGVLFGFLSPFS